MFSAKVSSLSSSKKIVKAAKEAMSKNGAKPVFFEFAKGVPTTCIEKLKKIQIEGYYYFKSQKNYILYEMGRLTKSGSSIWRKASKDRPSYLNGS